MYTKVVTSVGCNVSTVTVGSLVDLDRRTPSVVHISPICTFCSKEIMDYILVCPVNGCDCWKGHTICVANVMRNGEELIPLPNNCPTCDAVCKWCDIISKKLKIVQDDTSLESALQRVSLQEPEIIVIDSSEEDIIVISSSEEENSI